MTPDPKATPAATDKEIQAFFNGSVPLCGVCLGVSASWEGHDSNPPCRQTVANRIKARIEADREKIAALEAEIAVDDKLLENLNSLLAMFDCPQHGRCIPFAKEQVEMYRARIKELPNDKCESK